MTILTESEPKLSRIDGGKQVQTSFDAAHLCIRNCQTRFNSRPLDTGEDAAGCRGSGSVWKTPDGLATEVSDYVVRFLYVLTLQCFTILRSLSCVC